ncbi:MULTISPECIES: hypothetical protein [Acinetobacter]|uniref:DUF3137 domain-containing protein n=3 Tax=Acinetobacter TaxID=469 RepID=N9DCF9_9GAMM|nr:MULTISPECIES: hypothetical protein [Acinetobacter]ENV80324.1 hypothetical protein F942_01046 [Acinetobacter ursingii ANC 3649]MEC6125487.1 hypothetical protein [Acinetobacter ursingii]QXZ24476.1 hypothetical protein I6L31_07025 [Acinetobacter septicus]BBF76407.1 hypothetical protein URS_0360 [Acinetobacter ursingii]
MPIKTVQSAFHIRRKKNAHVFRNIARLWEIGEQVETHQQILDQLHPWGDHPTLRFDNGLPKFLMLLGALSFFAMFALPSIGLPFIFGFFSGIVLLFLAFILYETDDAIQEVARYLEEKSIETRYGLKFGQVPDHLSSYARPALFIQQLKNSFPFFDKGHDSNQISLYASATFKDDQDKAYPAFIFQYHYIDRIEVIDGNGDKVTIRRIDKNLYGICIFETQIRALAVNNLGSEIGFPYEVRWNSSDIQINQQLQIYGIDQLQMVKTLNPALLLRLSDFFKSRKGELIFHSHQNMMCFLGEADLFEVSSKAREIQDISSLRGHLRTFRLKHYEQLCSDLSTFLK